MRVHITSLSSRRLLLTVMGAFLFTAFLLMQGTQSASAAACAVPTTDYGTVTQTVTFDSAGSYRVWSRMKASATDATANSYLLEIDGNTCFTVGDDSTITSSSWKWVDYQAGATTNKINHTFSAGQHTIKMIGREAGVQLDRLLFLSATDTCVTNASTHNGDPCTTTTSNTPPTVSITAPANNATYTAPATIAIDATAADSNGTVSKVEFFQGTTKLGEDLTSPYSYSWTGVAAGSYSITAKATDNGAATTTSSAVAVTVSAAPTGQADLIITSVTASPANPAPGQAVTFSATVKNQGTVATNEGPGVLFTVNGQPTTWVAHTSSGIFAAGETRTLVANGGVNNVSTWPASAAGAYTVQGHVDDLGRIPESNDTNNTASMTLNVGSTTTARAEDINQDGSVNALDFLAFKADYGKCANLNNPRSNIDGSADGCVNALDFLRFKSAYGS